MKNNQNYDSELYKILNYEFPCPNTVIYDSNKNNAMKIEYIWDNSQEKIQSVKLTIFCNGCGKKSVYEVSREEILRKKGKKRDLKCFAFLSMVTLVL